MPHNRVISLQDAREEQGDGLQIQISSKYGSAKRNRHYSVLEYRVRAKPFLHLLLSTTSKPSYKMRPVPESDNYTATSDVNTSSSPPTYLRVSWRNSFRINLLYLKV